MENGTATAVRKMKDTESNIESRIILQVLERPGWESWIIKSSNTLQSDGPEA